MDRPRIDGSFFEIAVGATTSVGRCVDFKLTTCLPRFGGHHIPFAMATARAPDDFATPTAFAEHVEEVVTRLRYHAGMEFDSTRGLVTCAQVPVAPALHEDR